MSRPSGRQERIAHIAALLDVTPSLRLRDLSEQLGVTEMTLRRDAAEAGTAFACRGGYLVPERKTEHYDFESQMSRAIGAKRQAAEHALLLVPEGASVFLDTGTTLPHLARLLAQGRAGRITTHCFTTAEILQGRSTAPVLFLGGEVKSSTRSCHSPNQDMVLGQTPLDIAFLSAGGLDADGALSCSHDYEVDLKRAAIAHARQTFVVMDRGKLGLSRPAVFCNRREITGVVTETGLLSDGI